jgi:hypothetical protein
MAEKTKFKLHQSDIIRCLMSLRWSFVQSNPLTFIDISLLKDKPRSEGSLKLKFECLFKL